MRYHYDQGTPHVHRWRCDHQCYQLNKHRKSQEVIMEIFDEETNHNAWYLKGNRVIV